MIIYSPAKLNRFLAILGKRPDGYHNLEIITTVLERSYNLMDTLEGTLSNFTSLTVSGPMANDIPNDERNLVLKAWRLLEKTVRCQLPVKLCLQKHIPHGAGLGGGSSNAASALLLGNKLFNLNLSTSSLLNIGSQVGSDVPLFLLRGTVLGLDRGERVFPLEDIPLMPTIIVYPKLHISTRSVYETIVNIGYPEYKPCSGLSKGDIPILRNDLTDASIAICPQLNVVRNAILKSSGYPLLCGSGSCWAAFYKDINTRNNALKILQNMHSDWIFWEIDPC